MENNVALSTSFSANYSWDPIYSLELTKKYNLKFCQIYIGDNFKDKTLVSRINKFNDIDFLFHSNYNLEPSGIIKGEIDIINSINSKNKYVVFHHTIKVSLEDVLDSIKLLNSMGITVLFENFYEDYDRVEESVNSYIEILKTSIDRGYKLLPLIDFPRLFIDKAIEDNDPISLTYKLLDAVKLANTPLYTHLIDCRDSSQKRDSWCQIGDGSIPYNSIFSYIKKLEISIPLHILELEEEEQIPGSVDYLC